MFEIKLVIDLSEQTIKTAEEFNDTLRMLDVMHSGDFEKLIKNAKEKKETAPQAAQEKTVEVPMNTTPDVAPKADTPAETAEPVYTIEQIRAYCAKAKAAGLNIPAIIHEYGHADLLRNVDPKYYGDIKKAVDAQMNG